MLRRFLAMASAALVASASSGCGSTDSWVDSQAARGGPRNTATPPAATTRSRRRLIAQKLDWSRSVKGELGSGPALGSGGYLAVNGQTAGGCSLMVWENNNHGRQLVHPDGAGRRLHPAHCSTVSTTCTSASPG